MPNLLEASHPSHAVNDRADSFKGLGNEAYTRWTVFQQERERLFGVSWASVAFISDLPEPGCVYPMSFLGLPLLAVRDKSGDVKVFHNVCSHRGHRLVKEPGRVSGAIRCPYHSWTYDFDGQLRGTPHIGGTGVHELAGFDRGCHGLKPVRSAVWMGIVFVTLSESAPSFSDFIQPVETRWRPFWSDSGAERLLLAASDGHLEMTVRANWKLAVENYCESYHLPWVHPDLNSYSKLEDHYNIDGENGYSGQGSYVYRFAETAGVELPRLPEWPRDRLQHAEYLALYPNTLLGLQADHMFAVTIEPLAPEQSRERLMLSFVEDFATDPKHGSARRTVLEGWRAVFAEDVSAVEGMQQGRLSPAFEGGVFSPVMDVPTLDFHRWVIDKLSQQ